MLYMSRYEWISFYISSEEMNELTHSHESFAVAKLAHLMNKSETALDEFSKQIWPLLMFIGGASLGCYMASNYQFWSLIIPESIVILCMVEIVLHLQYKSKLPVSINIVSESDKSLLPNNSTSLKQNHISIAESSLRLTDIDTTHTTNPVENESKIQWDDILLDNNSTHKESQLRMFRNRSSSYVSISIPKDQAIENKAEVLRKSMSSHQISNNFVENYEI